MNRARPRSLLHALAWVLVLVAVALTFDRVLDDTDARDACRVAACRSRSDRT